jgi:ClpP class serine protease
MAEPQKPEKELPAATSTVSPSYTAVLQEHNVVATQRQMRLKLIEEIEKLESGTMRKKKAAVVAHVAREGGAGSLESVDIPVLGNMLRSIGDVYCLSFILQSPGGDGTVVETMVAMCRAQCKHLRVILPSRAKSAATMIALGADEIVMGPTSEMGPIDAQVPVVIEGLLRYVSAQSFIDARASLLKQYDEAITNKKDAQPILQMLASLDIPFIEECQRMMDFGRDVVRKLLSKHMLAKEKDKDKKIDKIVSMLSSVQTHMVHGRTITGSTARTDLGLDVKLLAKNNPLWEKVWEYYTRAEIHLGNVGASKMFETRFEMLFAKNQ